MSTPTYSNARQGQVWRAIPELFRARELLFDLVIKDLRMRYRYAAMGFLWAILEPLAFTAVITVVFTFAFPEKVAAVSQEGQPAFAVVFLSGFIFWQFFSSALTAATQSLLDNRTLVTKVYFPREVVPLAALGYPLLNLCIGMIVLMVVHLLFGGTLGLALLWLGALFLIQFLMVIGLALLFSCGNVHYRDVGYMVTVGLMLGFYASPIFYRLEWIFPSGWMRTLYLLNPMAGLITAYRQILFELRAPDVSLLIWPALVAVALFITGIVVFRKLAPTLSDRL